MNNSAKNMLVAPVKLPVFAMLFGPYGLMLDKIKQFIINGTAFAVVLMVLYIASGQDALCINSAYRQQHFCTNNVANFAIIHFISFFILCVFMRSWYQTAFMPEGIKSYKIFIPQLADLKILGLFAAFFLTLAIAGFSGYLLYVRVPNPDWKIELGYFTLVSFGFFVPLLALRFVSYVAFAAAGEPLPAPIVVWKKTAGNTFLILSSIIILMMIGLFISQALLRSFMIGGTNIGQWYVMLGSEYLSDIAVIFIAACFMNYCYLQKGFLFERNENGKSNN